jgi:hypothetical protein
MAGNSYETIYGVGLLDDIHNYFPALLYEQGRFQTLPTVFNYVRNQMNTRFNLYSYGSSRYSQGLARDIPVVPVPFIPSSSVGTTTTLPGGPDLGQLYRGYPQSQITSLNAANLLLSFLDLGLEGEVSPAARRPFTTNELLASLTPVIVRPSEEVIHINTQIINGSTVTQGMICTVCQDIIVHEDTCRRISACGHTYHQNCIDQWFARNVHCPTCRYDIRDGPIPHPPAIPIPPGPVAPAPVAASVAAANADATIGQEPTL